MTILVRPTNITNVMGLSLKTLPREAPTTNPTNQRVIIWNPKSENVKTSCIAPTQNPQIAPCFSPASKEYKSTNNSNKSGAWALLKSLNQVKVYLKV